MFTIKFRVCKQFADANGLLTESIVVWGVALPVVYLKKKLPNTGDARLPHHSQKQLRHLLPAPPDDIQVLPHHNTLQSYINFSWN